MADFLNPNEQVRHNGLRLAEVADLKTNYSNTN